MRQPAAGRGRGVASGGPRERTWTSRPPRRPARRRRRTLGASGRRRAAGRRRRVPTRRRAGSSRSRRSGSPLRRPRASCRGRGGRRRWLHRRCQVGKCRDPRSSGEGARGSMPQAGRWQRCHARSPAARGNHKTPQRRASRKWVPRGTEHALKGKESSTAWALTTRVPRTARISGNTGRLLLARGGDHECDQGR